MDNITFATVICRGITVRNSNANDKKQKFHEKAWMSAKASLLQTTSKK